MARGVAGKNRKLRRAGRSKLRDGLMTGFCRYATAVLAAALATPLQPGFAQEDYVAAATAYVRSQVLQWVRDPVLIEALRSQNADTAGLGQAQIEALDLQWRTELEQSDQPLIQKVMANAGSKFLRVKRDQSDGMITELILMDKVGLNAGQSDLTSDYWQGDEAKFRKSFGAGPDAIFVDEVEQDESTGLLQSQVSLTVKDPQTGEALGALTVGIDADKL